MGKSSSFYISIALAIILGLVVANYIFGWTTPSANPPSSNLPAPLNTGSSNQSKEGYLAVGTSTAPEYPLEVGNQLRVWGQIISKVASGTAPFVVDSPTVVANLNVDKLDGYDAADLSAGGDTIWGYSAPPGDCAPYNDCDGDGYTAFTGDCDESCDTCYVGSTAYTTSPDGKDQDCDGEIDEISDVICTPTYGDYVYFGYDSGCNWVKNGSYMYVSTGVDAPQDTQHCIPDTASCTEYAGGWGLCSASVGSFKRPYGSYVRCGGSFWYNDLSGYNCEDCYAFYSCKPMTGCATSLHYQ